MSGYLIILVLCAGLNAANIASYGNTIFNEALSPANAALGGNSSLIDPVSGGFLLNPANYFSEKSQILFSYRNILSGLGVSRTITYSSAEHRFYYAVGLVQRIISDIPNTTGALSYWGSDGPHLDYAKISYFDDKTYALFISGGVRINPEITAGFSLKPVIHKIEGAAAWGAGIDGGIVYRKNDRIGLGLSIRNIFPLIQKWNTGNIEIVLPEISGNLSYKYKTIQFHGGMSAQFTAHILSKSRLDYRFGAQYLLFDNIAVRAGTSRNIPLSAGFSVNINNYHMDYVLLAEDMLGKALLSHGVSIWIDLEKILSGMDKMNP